MLCPKCKSLMYPQGEKMVCRRCGHSCQTGEAQVLKIERKSREIPIYEESIADTLPLDEKAECPKCGNKGAYWYLLQTRKADEAETRFYQCTKCGHRWREY